MSDVVWEFYDSAYERVEIAEDLCMKAIAVMQYVSRGRVYVDVDPYPDAMARQWLGAYSETDISR